MLKSSLILALVAFLAIEYVQSNLIVVPQTLQAQPELLAPVTPIIPHNIEAQPTLLSATIPLAVAATEQLPQTLEAVEAPTAVAPTATTAGDQANLLNYQSIKINRKQKIHYPVDLIAKPSGCIPIDDLKNSEKVEKWLDPADKMTRQACWKHCLDKKSKFASLFNGDECYCSNGSLPKSITLAAGDKSCKGSHLQTCGSATCADFFVLKINTEHLRHVVRNLEADNIWVHKTSWATWHRYNDEKYEFALSEILPMSNAISAVYDCPAQTPVPAGCANFDVVLNGFEDFITSNLPSGQQSVTPIDVEWDLVFAGRKNSHNEQDVLLYRKTKCEWVLKVNEEIKREYVYLNFEDARRTLVLVDKNDAENTFKITDNLYKSFKRGVETAGFAGRWFNKIHSLKHYFEKSYECKNNLTNPWYIRY